MGRLIDRILLNALGAALCYLVYVNAFGSVPLACALAFVSMLLTRRAAAGARKWAASLPWTRRREAGKRATVWLEALARLPEGEARAAVEALLEGLYPGGLEGVALELAQRPTACPPLNAAELYSRWQGHRADARLLVVCTGKAEAGAFALAESLTDPPARLLDGDSLRAALARHSELLPPEDPSPSKRRSASKLPFRLPLVPRERIPRCLLTGLGLVLGYALLGHPLYLLAGLALLLLSGLALRRKRAPARLFAE